MILFLYEPKFSTQSFAYRSNKSAIGAVELVEKEILSGLYDYVLKIDISHFFDTIDWDILKTILQKEIKDLKEENEFLKKASAFFAKNLK